VSWTHHRARVAALSRDRAPDDPELLAARRDLAEARLAARIDQAGDLLDPAGRARLAERLLAGPRQ
jgi:hypothetical protein